MRNKRELPVVQGELLQEWGITTRGFLIIVKNNIKVGNPKIRNRNKRIKGVKRDSYEKSDSIFK